MVTRPTQSKGWWFIFATVVLLLLFIGNGLLVVSDPADSTNPLTFNSLISFVLAAAALGLGIGSNASAYLNPASTVAMKMVSPIVLAIVFVVVVPFFMSLGASVIN